MKYLVNLLVLIAVLPTLCAPNRSIGLAAVQSDTISAPTIKRIRIKGKKLIVTGDNFAQGAVIELFENGEPQRTVNDPDSPSTRLIAPKAGKRIPFDTIFGVTVCCDSMKMSS